MYHYVCFGTPSDPELRRGGVLRGGCRHDPPPVEPQDSHWTPCVSLVGDGNEPSGQRE